MIDLCKKIWFIMTLDCEGSAEWTSKSFDQKLHWSEKVAIKLHCMICKKSRMLNRQMTLLDERLSQMTTVREERLSDAARKRIRQVLKSQI